MGPRSLRSSAPIAGCVPLLLLLAGCGSGKGQDAGDGAEATIVGCDEISYDGEEFDRIGCARGLGSFAVRVQDGEVWADLEVLCEADCIAAVVVRDGSAGGGSLDGGVGGDGDGDGDAPGGGLFGDPCEGDVDCASGLFCDPEAQVSIAADGLPGGVPDVLRLLFPGGSCTPTPIAPYGPTSCEPGLPPGSQGCGSEGLCVVEPGFEQLFVACREPCVPDNETSGCDRNFYTCDLVVEACVEGCQSDEECRIIVLDGNADGVPDGQAYDTASAATCDTATRRCTHPDGGGVTGDPCARNDDCEPDGECLTSLRSLGGHPLPEGYCSKVGCEVPGRECTGQDAICTTARPYGGGADSRVPACFTRCEVGADAPEDVFGVDGHGAGCRPGYRCHYNGGAAEDGICVGGTYTEVTVENIGDACDTLDTCYSPYGYGQCITLGVGPATPPSGVCSILDCAAPGLPDDVCGAGNACILLQDDLTFCVPECDTADECAAGYACFDHDGAPGTSKVCYAACEADGDCRAGEQCQLVGGSSFGLCGS